jgi:hypothetical protein
LADRLSAVRFALCERSTIAPPTSRTKKHVSFRAGRLLHPETCLDTMTPDERVCHRYPSEFPQVMLVAGLLQTWLQVASILGEVLADLTRVRSRHTTWSYFRCDVSKVLQLSALTSEQNTTEK